MMGPPGPGGGQQNQLVDPNLQVALLAVMMAMQLQQVKFTWRLLCDNLIHGPDSI